MKHSLKDRFNFGKHRGKTIKQVIDKDPTYVEWAIKNVDGFELNLQADDYFEESMAEYYQWESNLFHGDDGHPMFYGDR